jgi:hypothetical protein
VIEIFSPSGPHKSRSITLSKDHYAHLKSASPNKKKSSNNKDNKDDTKIYFQENPYLNSPMSMRSTNSMTHHRNKNNDNVNNVNSTFENNNINSNINNNYINNSPRGPIGRAPHIQAVEDANGEVQHVYSGKNNLASGDFGSI